MSVIEWAEPPAKKTKGSERDGAIAVELKAAPGVWARARTGKRSTLSAVASKWRNDGFEAAVRDDDGAETSSLYLRAPAASE